MKLNPMQRLGLRATQSAYAYGAACEAGDRTNAIRHAKSLLKALAVLASLDTMGPFTVESNARTTGANLHATGLTAWLEHSAFFGPVLYAHSRTEGGTTGPLRMRLVFMLTTPEGIVETAQMMHRHATHGINNSTTH